MQGHLQVPMWTLVLACALVPSGARAEMPRLLRELVNSLGFARSDVSRIGNDVLVRELDVSDPSRRAAFAAIVQIESDGSRLVEELSPVELAGRAHGADDFGGFHDPVRPEDVTRLRFSDDEMEVLADCQLQRCKFKLGRQGIEQLGSIDWDRDDAGDQFAKLFRREALAYVEQYRKKGNGALIVYEDKSRPVALSDTVESIVNQFTGMRRHAPAFSA